MHQYTHSKRILPLRMHRNESDHFENYSEALLVVSVKNSKMPVIDKSLKTVITYRLNTTIREDRPQSRKKLE